MGLHGKASICLFLGYGCNVPACIGCRIMETQRERLLAGFVTVLIPCAARTVVILGLVGRYIGIPAALGLYAFDLLLVFTLGRVGFKALPGEPVGLIMEMPPYKMPSMKTVARKTWARTKDFVYIAFPLIIVGSIVLEALAITGLIWPIAELMNPLIVGWLGLPSIAGIPVIFGILRKELTLILLADLAGALNFSQVLTPVQMIVFSLVTMIYVPCIATIAALVREFKWKKALAISIIDILLALVIGGVAFRLLTYILG
jgi:ferrous iron transport protein B